MLLKASGNCVAHTDHGAHRVREAAHHVLPRPGEGGICWPQSAWGALKESEDHLIANEEPQVIAESPKVMKEHFGVPQSAVAREMRVRPRLLQTLLELPQTEPIGNVVSLRGSARILGGTAAGRVVWASVQALAAIRPAAGFVSRNAVMDGPRTPHRAAVRGVHAAQALPDTYALSPCSSLPLMPLQVGFPLGKQPHHGDAERGKTRLCGRPQRLNAPAPAPAQLPSVRHQPPARLSHSWMKRSTRSFTRSMTASREGCRATTNTQRTSLLCCSSALPEHVPSG